MDPRDEAVLAVSQQALRAVRLFRRQFLQLLSVHSLTWPAPSSLRNYEVQEWLYEKLFESHANPFLPPERYRFRALKPLLVKIEQSIVDPEEDAISDNLMDTLSTFMATPLPSESEAAQQKSWVTYTAPSPFPSLQAPEATLKLQESRAVISGAGTTGLRTWEAALHLASYLTSSSSHAVLVKDKSVIELGAGTGFLSMLCSKVLQARHVTATDGDQGVVDALKQNLFFEDLDKEVKADVLLWGRTLKDSWVEEEGRTQPYDVVVGADVTYDKAVIPALVSTIREFFELWPQVLVLVSATVRNEDTFSAFECACASNDFAVSEIEHPLIPMAEQEYLFHSTEVPIKILSIKAPEKIRDPFAV